MNKMQLQFGYRKPSANRGGLARRLSALAMSLLLVCSLPLAAFAEEYDLAQGSVSIEAKADGQYVTHGSNDAVVDNTPVITQSNNETPTTNTITIKAEENTTANVTLDGVNIVTGGAAIQTSGDGNVTIELDGENTVQSGDMRAGVEKNNGGNLTITDENGTDGSLKATGGRNGAGIGGGSRGSGSNITITGSAEVTAQGGDEGAGIGGGPCGSGSNITITGSAEVTAKGGNSGSGIGGGLDGSGSVITITGSAEVTAQGGDFGAGIGGGTQGDGSNITISGSAQVGATGGRDGAGIGGGSNGSGSVITITGSAEVSAKGGDSGSGIGAGSNGKVNGTGSDITVSGDAQVKAQGGNQYTLFGQNYYGAGAAIGNGGENSYGTAPNPGDDVTPNTVDLNEGWIAKYAPGADMDSATPNSVNYKGETGVTTSENVTLVPEKAPTCIEEGHTAGFQCGNDQVGVEALQTVDHSYGGYVSNNDATCTSDGTKSRACIWCNAEDPISISDPGTMLRHSFTNYVSNNDATYEQDGTKTAKCDHPGCDATDTIPDPGTRLPAPAFQVKGKDGKGVACETERKDGVLTITVDADFASLTGYLGGLQGLRAQGVETIVFVTNGATSTFALADLLASMTAGDSYTLTHDGTTVTFTLATGTDISGILK